MSEGLDDSTQYEGKHGYALVDGESYAGAMRAIHEYSVEVTKLNERIRELEAETWKLQKQLQHSLANNICPDHRDKQSGKPCLACEIERLRGAIHKHHKQFPDEPMDGEYTLWKAVGIDYNDSEDS
jgi:hypothetical protein